MRWRSPKVKPLVIDYDDPEFSGAGERLARSSTRISLRPAIHVRLEDARRRVGRDTLNYTSGTTGDPKGVVYHHRGAYLLAIGNVLTGSMGKHCVYLWTCRCSTATAGAFPDDLGGGRHACACARCARLRCTTPSPPQGTTSAARRS
jgi:fatty-acyl-CoA synthase